MPSASQRARRRSALWLVSGTMIAGVTLAGCSLFSSGGGQPTPAAPTDGGSPSVTGSPLAPTGSPSESVTGSPLAPSESGSPATPTGSPGGSGAPSGSVAPVNCTEVTPVRVEKVSAEPRRTLEVVTLVSDGRNLTPGTREQSDFLTPVLIAPDGSQNTDEATMQKIATLIASSSRNRVLLARPNAPDQNAQAAKPPYNTPGTYVAYSSSATLNADIVVNCSGSEQRWQFRAESDQTLGVVNCAVEPPRSNGVARQVYSANC